MQAIILAAGMGKRLKEYTKNNTKCMVKVNGVTMIERLLRQLDGRGLSKVVIVEGYEGAKLIKHVKSLDINTPVEFINNPVYDKTNNIYSLCLAKDRLLLEDTLLFESDLIFDDEILDRVIEDPRDTVAVVDKFESWMDGSCVRLSSDDRIKVFIPKNAFSFNERDEYYKTVNIYKFSRDFAQRYYVPFLEAYQKALGKNEYYEQVLRVITMLDEPVIGALKLSTEKWYEIDDVQDLDIATSLFASDEGERLKLIQKRYGGYWRYPKLLDTSYLVNPYFPSEKLKEEMKSNFDDLLSMYPSGMEVNSLIASKDFGIRPEHVVVGNGAAELIKSLVEKFIASGRIGCVRPTFEEYPNRTDEDRIVEYVPDDPFFRYSADDLISFYSLPENRVDTLILINPDNPSGNYIEKADIIRLADWCKADGVRLVLDESFVDFADEEDSSFLDEVLLGRFSDMIVVKSISKSYGVPGIRLGILCSADEKLIADMKKDVAIWNINSFAEYFLQIFEKYKKDYLAAMAKFKAERKRFYGELSAVDGIKVAPSAANYFMVEIINGRTSLDIAKRFLCDENILVKDLTGKIGNGRQFLRIEIRDAKDNRLFIEALRRILGKEAG